MKLAISLVFASVAFAQPATLTLTGPTAVRPGDAVTVSVGLAGTSAAYAVAWTLTKPAGVTLAATAGAALTSAQKIITEGSNNGKIIGAGINANPIRPGELVKYAFTVHAAAAGGSTLTFSVSDPLGATLQGAAIALAPGTPLAIKVLKAPDANGDGRVDSVDVLIAANQAVGLAACDSRGDVNKDSKCDLIDTQLVVHAALEESLEEMP